MNGFKLISAVVAGLFGIVLLAMILPLGMGRSPVAFSVIEMLVGLLRCLHEIAALVMLKMRRREILGFGHQIGKANADMLPKLRFKCI